jgi:DNA polymerase sigma
VFLMDWMTMIYRPSFRFRRKNKLFRSIFALQQEHCWTLQTLKLTRFYSILLYFRWVSIEQTNYTNERTVINIFPSKIKSHLSLPTLKNWPSNEQPEECSISGAPNLYLLCLPESSVINIAPPPPQPPSGNSERIYPS